MMVCPVGTSVQSCRPMTTRAGVHCTMQPGTTAQISWLLPWTWRKVCVCVCERERGVWVGGGGGIGVCMLEAKNEWVNVLCPPYCSKWRGAYIPRNHTYQTHDP